MVTMEEIQAAYYMVAATGVLVAAVYYVMNIQTNKKNQELSLRALEQAAQTQRQTLDTRQAQLLMSLYQKWSESEFQNAYNEIQSWEWRDYEDYMEK